MQLQMCYQSAANLHKIKSPELGL